MNGGDAQTAKIGGVPVEGKVWLAPLAGITIPAVRRFFRELGAALTHTEMVSSSGLLMKNRKTAEMLKGSERENPLVLQLFAGDSKSLVESAEIAMKAGVFEAFSINMACPVPKVRKKGAGAQLLYRRDLAVEMVRELAKAGLPVWPKIRKHPSGSRTETLAFCEALLESGADLICLHGRTPQELYAGTADRQVVHEASAAFPGRVAASGDVFEKEDIAEYLRNGASAVLVARGALRDPFLFQDGVPPAEPLERALFLVRLGDSIFEENGPKAAASLIKRFVSGMFKGIRGNSSYRREVASSSHWPEMREKLCSCIHYFDERGSADV